MMHASRGRPWVLLQHIAVEGAGLIGEEAAAVGIELRPCRVDLGDPVPPAEEVGGVVAMGGPMSAYEVEAHPHLLDEQRLLAGAARAGVPVLAICLGSQLLAAGLGGSVAPGAVGESGWTTVALTGAGRADPVLGPAGPEVPVLQYHRDGFELPPSCARLATSPAYPAQAFRFGRCAYGLQFHLELAADLAQAIGHDIPSDPVAEAATRRAGRGIARRFMARATSLA